MKTSSAYIIPADFPDPDIIRVNDTYYMVSTTMHFMPGCVILRSHNLTDWEHAAYVYDELEQTPGQTLSDNKGVYGKGMWAACLRYHNNKFYISFVANDTHKTYLFTSDKIEGPWKRSEIQGFYHDMSLLFDDDGRVFCVSGNKDIWLTEFKEDLSGPKEGGIHKIIVQDDAEKIILGYEGSHFYKINGKYYIFFIHMPKGKMRTQACFYSDKIEGPYKGGDVLCSDLCGWNSGTAQGGIVQTPDGSWFSVVFQDHGALGRIPVLVPVDFSKDFPVFGKDGKAPEKVAVTDLKPGYEYAPLYSDDFTNPVWQWNHIPDKSLIEITKNTYSIKTGKLCINPVQAQNTLTQRTFTEHCTGEVFLDASNINDGDVAGLCALEGEYSFIGITKKSGKLYLIKAEHKIPYSPWTMSVFDDTQPEIKEEKEIQTPRLFLKAVFSLEHQKEQVQFFYSLADDSSKNQNTKSASTAEALLIPSANPFTPFGTPAPLRYTLDQFVGVRFALFYYSTIKTGGKVIFRDFKMRIGEQNYIY
jgi:beta-xylosidase